MDRVRAPDHVIETDNISRWVSVRFQRDPDTQPWTILTSPMGVMLLAQRLHEADTSWGALTILLSVGVPVRTGVLVEHSPPPIYALPLASRRQMLPPWRKREDRPTVSDYYSYTQRVLEIAQRLHARAAWLKGGIIWRIMHHISGREWQVLKEGEVGDGPSAQTDHHHPVTTRVEGAAYYDDGLSLDEMNIIAGVVKVYTGM